MDRFALALARRKAVDRKEFFEACEFFARTRSRLRSDGGVPVLVDVAGGHGLVAALVAIFKYKQFDRVIVRDPRRPKSFDLVVAAASEVAPWVEGRILYESTKIGPQHAPLPEGCTVTSVHGCRGLTDKIITAAANADASAVALMPCCCAPPDSKRQDCWTCLTRCSQVQVHPSSPSRGQMRPQRLMRRKGFVRLSAYRWRLTCIARTR